MAALDQRIGELIRWERTTMIDPTTEQCVLAAVTAAREVYAAQRFHTWAENWISGHDRTPASAREIADHVRKSTGEKNEVDLADEAMRTATELVEKGMDPEDAMDIADAELGEAMQEPPPVSVDPEAESAKAAAQAAYIAADAAAFYVIGLFSLAADFAELACSKAALCKELRSPTP